MWRSKEQLAREQLERYANCFKKDMLTVHELTSCVLELLADSSDRLALWASAPAEVREHVIKCLKEFGVPPFVIFSISADKEWCAAQAARQREVAAELLRIGAD
jgi:hypothetical protein